MASNKYTWEQKIKLKSDSMPPVWGEEAHLLLFSV